MTSAAPLPCRVRNLLDLLIFEIPQNIDTQIKWGGREGKTSLSFATFPPSFCPSKFGAQVIKAFFRSAPSPFVPLLVRYF